MLYLRQTRFVFTIGNKPTKIKCICSFIVLIDVGKIAKPSNTSLMKNDIKTYPVNVFFAFVNLVPSETVCVYVIWVLPLCLLFHISD